jgi:hypothetical protein
MTTSLVVGRSKPGCGLCPALGFKDLHHPGWEGGRGELGPTSAWAGDLLLPPTFGREGSHQPCGGGELRQRGTGRPQVSSTPVCLARWLSWLCRSHRRCLLPLDPGVAVRPPHGLLLRRAHRGIVQDVVCRMGGVRVLGLSCPHSGTMPPRGDRCLPVREDLSGDLPVQVGAPAVRWRSAGAQVAAVVDAEVVVARGGFSADETVGATRVQTSGSLALMACPRPSSGDMGEGLVTAASALRSSLLLFSRP